MPRLTDSLAINDPFLDRRTKLLPCQKERVLSLHNTGASQRKLAAMFGVSRRLITFVIDPSKQLANLERRQERGGTKQYYDKSKHADSMRTHRIYKHQILKA